MSTGDLWAITCYFNSENDPCREFNFKLFAERLKKQNVPFLTVELVASEEDKGNPDVKEMSSMYHRVVHPHVLWSKEALVNIGLKILPPECTKVCWIDADILFPFNDDWGAQCSAALDKHKVIQPYEKYFFLLRQFMDAKLWDDKRYPEDYRFSFASNYVNGRQTKDFTKNNHPGYAWAARRSVLDEIGGLYSFGICMADVLMAYAFITKREEDIPKIWEYPSMKLVFGTWGPKLRGHVEDWMRRAVHAVGGDVGVLDGVFIHHLFHGSVMVRQYKALHEAYSIYDPYEHSRINDDGVLEWTDKAPEHFKDKVKGYFSLRQKINAIQKPKPTSRIIEN